MSDALPVNYNIVTFQPDGAKRNRFVALLLEGDFVVTPGIRPNVNTATLSFPEFDKLGSDPFVYGTVGFWYTRPPSDDYEPDVAYRGWRIVDVEAIESGIPNRAEVPRVTVYRIALADLRERIQPPHGGRVTLGLVNPTLTEPYDLPATPPPLQEPRETVELIVHCLRQTGAPFMHPSASLNNAGPPPSLKLFGTPAAEALDRLLDHATGVLVPSLGGQLQAWRVGEGQQPTIPTHLALWSMSFQRGDRRGQIVVFTSAPNAILETRELRGAKGVGAEWEYVIQDQTGTWREINDQRLKDNGLIIPGGPIETVRQGFRGVKGTFKYQVRDQLYHYIRLKRDNFRPGVQRIVRQRFDAKRKIRDIEVMASVPVYSHQTGTWSNSNEPILCSATHLHGTQNVIRIKERLGKIKPDADGANPAPTTDPDALFDELGENDLIVKLTTEAGQKPPASLGGTVWVPEYYTVGVKWEVTGTSRELKVLKGDELQAVVNRPTIDTVFVSRPELRLIREYTNWREDATQKVTNEEELEEQAKLLAHRFLASDRSPYQSVGVKGFFAADLNGVVSEVRISQQRLTTTIKVNSHWRMMGPQLVRDLQESVGAAVPHQGKLQEFATAIGVAGGVQPVVPLRPESPPPAPPPDLFLVRVQLDGGAQGTKTSRATWTYTVFSVDGFPLGTKVTVDRPRPSGALIAGTGIGIAFRNNDQTKSLRLWDAGEVYILGDCPAD